MVSAMGLNSLPNEVLDLVLDLLGVVDVVRVSMASFLTTPWSQTTITHP